MFSFFPNFRVGLSALSVSFGLFQACSAQVVISEFLSDNRDGIEDADGDASDWIEVRNAGAVAVDLAGWTLTDLAAQPGMWTFPARVLEAGEFLVVFASGKNRTNPVAELHTNFSLDADGEYLALLDPAAEVASEFDFPAQLEDIAYGESGNVVTEVLVAEGAAARWHVPTAPVAGWTGLAFADGAWAGGPTGIGYDTVGEYDAFIGTEVQAPMFGLRGSVYIRIPFAISSPGELVNLRLRMRYDDGFVAWVNGDRAAGANAPEALGWNALATAAHLDGEALIPLPFAVDAALPALVDGDNVLAIQGMNVALGSSDLLMLPELLADRFDPSATETVGFLTSPSPGQHNANAVAGFVAAVDFSSQRGFYSAPVSVSLSSPTDGASIRYTTDGSAPSESIGTVYSAPVNLNTTTILRAIAYRTGDASSPVAIHTYLFAADIINQADMDPDVVTDAIYSRKIEADLSANLPVVSMLVDEARFFGDQGIYSNPTLSGRGAEVPVSVEFFNPAAPGEQFQIDAGIRIHGGNARAHPKKPMRLYFRGDYGPRKLEFPLFDGSPVDSFDQLILRGGGHDSWSLAATFGRDPDTDLPAHGTLMRDQFLRKTELAMGILSPRGRYVHLYINARYWGVYDLHERANAEYFASHLGGGAPDYDVLHHPSVFGQDYTIVDGDAAAWEAARAIVDGGVTSAEQYRDIQEYLDLDNLIDHLITRMWSGDYDWCGPIFRGGRDVTYFGNKNWYAGRRSRDKPGTFRFFTWDGEMSMGSHLMINLGQQPPPDQRVSDFDLTGADDPGSPVEFYAALRQYPEFQRRFADRLHEHLFNGGALSTAVSRARWDGMWGDLRGAMVGESARWGDEGIAGQGEVPVFTRNGHWLPEVFWVRDTFIPTRNATLLAQFRARGLYPDTAAPVFNQHGGAVADGFMLEMDAGGADIYYTTDGSDPHSAAEAEFFTFIDEFVPAAALVPSVANGGATVGDTWKGVASPANIAAWTTGQTGVGYEDRGTNYAPFLNLYIAPGRGVFVRVPFTVDAGVAPASLASLTLSMKYDDGFVAYLNGVEVARGNAPGTPGWDSLATANRPDSQAGVYQAFDIIASRGLLVEGQNMLAVHALNVTAASSDLLCLPMLTGSKAIRSGGPAATALLYSLPVQLDRSVEIRARAQASGAGEWSALTAATFLVGELASAANLVVSELNYRPRPPASAAELAVADGRADFEFVELMNIGPVPIDLTGVHFTQGIEFEFPPGGAVSVLAPGGYALVVEDSAAFQARYGATAAARVAGEFAGDTKLSNDGEAITLLAADSTPIKSFTYSDSAPWPTAADGAGYSLTLIDPEANPDHGLAASWAASAEIDGTPAGETSTAGFATWQADHFDPASPGYATRSAPGADPDRDGWSNALEYALGTDPAKSGEMPEVEVFIADEGGVGYLAVRYVASALADVQIAAEVAGTLGAWTADTTSAADPEDLGGGRIRYSLRATAPIVPGAAQQLRLRVTVQN